MTESRLVIAKVFMIVMAFLYEVINILEFDEDEQHCECTKCHWLFTLMITFILDESDHNKNNLKKYEAALCSILCITHYSIA